MSDAPDRAWHFYIEDMMRFTRKALVYSNGLDQKTFVSSEMIYDATLRNLELIGEAATHIPSEIRAAHPEVAWRQIIATRNRLIHGYLGIDNDTVWSILQDDLPSLLACLAAIRESYLSE